MTAVSEPEPQNKPSELPGQSTLSPEIRKKILPDPKPKSSRPPEQTPPHTQDTPGQYSTHKKPGKPKEVQFSQSVGALAGYLISQEGKLRFRCLDGAEFPVLSVDPVLSLFLLSRPSAVGRFAHWLVYPRCDRKGQLGVNLKAVSLDPEKHPVPLPIDTAKIGGKLVAFEEEDGCMIINIRRNLSGNCYKELLQKQIIKTNPALQTFQVKVWGKPPVEVGELVMLVALREGEKLVTV